MAGGRGKAGWSVVLGVLAVATMPVAIALTRYSGSYELLHAGFAIPIGFAFGVAAIFAARRARALDNATLGRAGGRKSAATGRLLGIAGVCIASSALIAVAVYGVLVYSGR
jgi:hypothetical protein